LAFNFLPYQSRWLPYAIVIFGSIVGLSTFLAKESEVISYMGDDPKTCVNCHVMTSEYNSWMHSSHREATSCNDCHVPHNNIFNKYYFKAKDGLRHATIFTLRREPQVIFIKEEGKAVVQENCIRCHSDLLSNEKVMNYTTVYHHERTERQCWECHRETPHGRVNSLSSVPYARVPVPDSPVPSWFRRIRKK